MNINEIFKYKKFDSKLLKAYGFKKKEGEYRLSFPINENQFELHITVKDAEIITKLIDKDLNEEYFLHLLDNPQGEFVGKIKTEYENILNDICLNCCISNAFTENNTVRIIRYAKNKYNDELEFLWKNSPDCAILRRKDTQKWYAVVMKITENKLGIKSTKLTEVVNFRINPKDTDSIIDNYKYFRAYHMNKKSWISLNLTSDFNDGEIEEKMDNSYILAIK